MVCDKFHWLLLGAILYTTQEHPGEKVNDTVFYKAIADDFWGRNFFKII
ncbi:hypothetical protein M23134_01897 [Microscilla marina ATCC 23134]|uniref:Uncharacterized protein n=1 Tax=Microscilla marina ATCC 23134 TaxID=313606 RepID=A1ZC67_MICM2|nr:hypothetical protein M23134_01897 [Microscilla marina ATCC 23134]